MRRINLADYNSAAQVIVNEFYKATALSIAYNLYREYKRTSVDKVVEHIMKAVNKDIVASAARLARKALKTEYINITEATIKGYAVYVEDSYPNEITVYFSQGDGIELKELNSDKIYTMKQMIMPFKPYGRVQVSGFHTGGLISKDARVTDYPGMLHNKLSFTLPSFYDFFDHPDNYVPNSAFVFGSKKTAINAAKGLAKILKNHCSGLGVFSLTKAQIRARINKGTRLAVTRKPRGRKEYLASTDTYNLGDYIYEIGIQGASRRVKVVEGVGIELDLDPEGETTGEKRVPVGFYKWFDDIKDNPIVHYVLKILLTGTRLPEKGRTGIIDSLAVDLNEAFYSSTSSLSRTLLIDYDTLMSPSTIKAALDGLTMREISVGSFGLTTEEVTNFMALLGLIVVLCSYVPAHITRCLIRSMSKGDLPFKISEYEVKLNEYRPYKFDRSPYFDSQFTATAVDYETGEEAELHISKRELKDFRVDMPRILFGAKTGIKLKLEEPGIIAEEWLLSRMFNNYYPVYNEEGEDWEWYSHLVTTQVRKQEGSVIYDEVIAEI